MSINLLNSRNCVNMLLWEWNKYHARSKYKLMLVIELYHFFIVSCNTFLLLKCFYNFYKWAINIFSARMIVESWILFYFYIYVWFEPLEKIQIQSFHISMNTYHMHLVCSLILSDAFRLIHGGLHTVYWYCQTGQDKAFLNELQVKHEFGVFSSCIWTDNCRFSTILSGSNKVC